MHEDPYLISYRISPYKDSIPGWQVGGDGHVPQIVRFLIDLRLAVGLLTP